jgi:hypothetical protein
MLGMVLAATFAMRAACAAGIALGAPVVASDGGLDVPVTLTPASQQSIAALQFDLHYNAGQFAYTQAAAGAAATTAGKETAASEQEPGVVRIVVAGINSDTLASGTVATLHFQPADKTDSAATFLGNASLDEVVLSGPLGENADEPVSESSASTSSYQSAQSKVGQTQSSSGNSSGSNGSSSLTTAASPSTAALGQTVSAGAAYVSAKDKSPQTSTANSVASPGVLVVPGAPPQRIAGGASPVSPAVPSRTAIQTTPPFAGHASKAMTAPARAQEKAEASALSSSGTAESSPPSETAPLRIAKLDVVPLHTEFPALAEKTHLESPTGFPSNSALYVLLCAPLVIMFTALCVWVMKKG